MDKSSKKLLWAAAVCSMLAASLVVFEIYVDTLDASINRLIPAGDVRGLITLILLIFAVLTAISAND